MPTRIKRYEERAELLDALLARIEAEMGPAAEVERRDFVRGRVLGLFGGVKMVEVIATVEIDTTPGAFAHAAGQALPIPDTLATQPQHPPVVEAVPPAPAPGSSGAPPLAGAPLINATAATMPAVPAAQGPRFDARAAEPTALADWTPAPAIAPALSQPLRATPVAPVAPLASAPGPAPAEPLAQAAPPVPAASQEAAAPSGELLDLKSSILELQQTMRLLIEQQQLMLSAAPAAPVAAAAGVEPAPADAVPQDAPLAPDEPDTAAIAPAGPEPQVAARPGIRSAPRLLNPMAIDPAALLEGIQRGAYERLLDWNIGPYDALELINTAMSDPAAGPPLDSAELLTRVTREICRNVLLSGGIQLRKSPPGKVVALIGATGVGKTTTIAKLAANFAFQQGKRVSLVSLDNYRIAAAEQLRTYTDIMGIDLDIVFSREEFDQVLSLRRHNDLVLIDTAGRSPLNEKQIYELREIFSAHPPDEVHLVIAAPTKADDLRLILENFLPLSYDYVIVSKLDETRSLGCLYNISRHSPGHAGRGVPISYFTVGQSVPEDIRTAELPFIQAWIEQGRIV